MRYFWIWLLVLALFGCRDKENDSSDVSGKPASVSDTITASDLANMLEASLDIDRLIEEIRAEPSSKEMEADLIKRRELLDSASAYTITKYVRTKGWIRKSTYGQEASDAALRILLRGPVVYQDNLLPILGREADTREANPVYVAEILDLSRIRAGDKQFFGTQLSFNSQKGRFVIHPIFDEKNLEARRNNMGLEPMKTYWEKQGIEYSPPN